MTCTCPHARAQMDTCADVRRPSHMLTVINTHIPRHAHSHVYTPTVVSTTFAAKDTLTRVTALRRNVGQCWNYSSEEGELVDYKYREPARDGPNKNSIIMQCSAAGFGLLSANKAHYPSLCCFTHTPEWKLIIWWVSKDTHNYPEMRSFIIWWLAMPNATWLESNGCFICHYVSLWLAAHVPVWKEKFSNLWVFSPVEKLLCLTPPNPTPHTRNIKARPH